MSSKQHYNYISRFNIQLKKHALVPELVGIVLILISFGLFTFHLKVLGCVAYLVGLGFIIYTIYKIDSLA